jgi:hypothetical protein
VPKCAHDEDHGRVSDDLYRRAKAEATLRGRKLKDWNCGSKLRAHRIDVGAWPR